MTGKTTIAKYLLERIQSEGNVRGAYVNCWEKNTCYAILQEILNNLRALGTEERNNSLKLDELRCHINREFFVLILNEIDTLPLKEWNTALYNLCNIDKIGLIYIGESQFPSLALEDRVRSRLNPQIIDFPQYTAKDLVGILRQRDLREVKRRLMAFEVIQIDSKRLDDIEELYPSYFRFKLPRWQFTARDVRTGGTWIAYAREGGIS